MDAVAQGAAEMKLLAIVFLMFTVRYDGGVWHDKADAMPMSRADCAKYAGDYGDGVRARCYRKVR
jgi:hypothetical protein